MLPGYISDTNVLINDTTYGERTSGLISVQSNKPYIFSIIQTTDSNPNWLAVAEYTKEGYFIKRITNTNTQATQISFTTGSTTKFIRISARNLQNATKIQLEQNSLITDYEEYVESKIYVKNDNDVYEEFISKKDIKSGSNENGLWIKYPDGTLICASSQNTCEASVSYKEIIFPIQFKEVYALTITNRFLNDPNIVWSYDSLKSSGFRAYPKRNLATPSIATSFSYIAIGKWA